MLICRYADGGSLTRQVIAYLEIAKEGLSAVTISTHYQFAPRPSPCGASVRGSGDRRQRAYGGHEGRAESRPVKFAPPANHLDRQISISTEVR